MKKLLDDRNAAMKKLEPFQEKRESGEELSEEEAKEEKRLKIQYEQLNKMVEDISREEEKIDDAKREGGNTQDNIWLPTVEIPGLDPDVTKRRLQKVPRKD